MNTKQPPALLAPSRQVPMALSPELCAPRWGSQHSPPPSTGLHAHGNLQPPRIPDGEPPGMGRTPSLSILPPGSVPRRCPLSSGLAVPRFLQAPASLLSCLERCRNGIKTLFSPTWGLQGHPCLAGNDVKELGWGWLPGALPPLSRRDRGSVPCHPQHRGSTHARHPPRQRRTTRGKPTASPCPRPSAEPVPPGAIPGARGGACGNRGRGCGG